MAGYCHSYEHYGLKTFPIKDVSKSSEIGHGVFSKVYDGTLRQNGVELKVAIKILKSQERLVEEAYSEIKILRNLIHENVVQLHGIVEIDTWRQPPWLIFEFVKGGNLLNLVKSFEIEDEKLIKYCRDVARGMDYLHSNQVLHKDLAARNVLIDGNIAKVSDFGISSLLSDEEGNDEYYQLAPGNPKWQPGQRGKWASVRSSAIECYTEGKYFKATDVWAFGVLLWEIWSDGEKPYDKNKEKARNLIKTGFSPLDISRPYKCPEQIMNLMKATFKQKRQLRPEFMYVLSTLDKICRLYPEPEEIYYDYHQPQSYVSNQTSYRSNSSNNNRTPRHISLTTAKVEKEPETSTSAVVGWVLAGTALVTGIAALAVLAAVDENPRRNNNRSEDKD